MSKSPPPLSSVKTRSLYVALVAGAIGAVLALIRPGEAALAYRFALFACMAPAVGCMIFVLIHRSTGGQWATDLKPFLRAGASALPWLWLLVLPLLLAHRPPPGSAGAALYEGLPLVAVRTAVIAAVLFWLRWAVSLEPGDDRAARRNQHRWVGPVGLIALVFTFTFLADDWIAAYQPHWHSTAFAAVWMSSQSVAGLSFCILGALTLGAKPSREGLAGRPVGNDWGNLLMASLLFWCYVEFGQFLIIWSGNKPDEISWYLARQQGLWRWVPPALALGNFLIPFVLLLSRPLKETAKGLGILAGVLLAGQVVYEGWIVLPSGPPLSAVGALLSVALLVAMGAVLFRQFFALAAKAVPANR